MKNDKCVIASGQSKAATCEQRSNPEGCEGFSPKQSNTNALNTVTSHVILKPEGLKNLITKRFFASLRMTIM
jgi:hypothetical protein